MFAVFNGLLVTFDYLMCCVLVFPALCLYDKWSATGCCGCCFPCCISWNCCMKKNRQDDNDDIPQDEGRIRDDFSGSQLVSDQNDDEPQSLIRRILTSFYNVLHKVRWVLLVICVGALAVATIFALRLELPQSSDVRLLSNSNQFERSFEWRKELMSSAVDATEGSDAIVIWGVKPADTGNHNNPSTCIRYCAT